MYLFSRRAGLAPGNTREAITWATAITEKVNEITGLNVGLYMQTFSPEVGTLSWSTFLPTFRLSKPPTTSSSWMMHTFRWSMRRQVLARWCRRHLAADRLRRTRSEPADPIRDDRANSVRGGEPHQGHRAGYLDRTTGRENCWARRCCSQPADRQLRSRWLAQWLRRRAGDGTSAAGASRRRQIRGVRRQGRP